MTTYPNMSLVLPTRGAPGAGLWGNTDDANWALVDGHDHSSGKGLPIKTAGISIDADLSFSSLWAVTALKRATFASVAPPAVNKSLFVGDGTGGTTANELYWTSNAGVNVKLTSGSSLNVSAFTGGIGGDYTSVSAAVAYDDAGKRYTFKEGTSDSNGWARLACGSVRIIEFNTSESVYVEQLAPAALAVSYAMTWPTAVPGTTAVAQIDNAGQWSFTNTIVNDLVMSSGKRYKHGDLIMHVSPIVGSGTGWAWDATNGYLLSSGAGTWSIGIPTLVGWRLKSLTFELKGDGAADLSGGVLIRHKAGAVGTDTAIGATNPPASYVDQVINFTDTTIVDGDTFYINLTANAANLQVGEIRVTYDFP